LQPETTHFLGGLFGVVKLKKSQAWDSSQLSPPMIFNNLIIEVLMKSIQEVFLWRVSLWEKNSGWECSVSVVANSLRNARRAGVEVIVDRGDILGNLGKKEINKTSVQLIESAYEVIYDH